MRNFTTYNTAMVIYGQALTKPTIHEFLSQVARLEQLGEESGIPNSMGKERFAPLEPVRLDISEMADKMSSI